MIEHHNVNSQIVSHELRRLAVSTNQFGIDALRALDRIEPPDKVIVFCPVCIASSLAMVMMGSSKYPVVSSLRQALYVWSMRPQEINRGYRDIFEHIEINQAQIANGSRSLGAHRPTIVKSAKLGHGTRSKRDVVDDHVQTSLKSDRSSGLSLLNMVRLKELSERIAQNNKLVWWDSPSVTANKSVHRLHSRELTSRFNLSPHDQYKITGADSRGLLGDFSQMSALSNIYMQRGFTMNYSYNLLLRQFYKTVIHPIDFIRNWDETRQHINSLVASGTEGKIRELLRRDSFEGTGKPKILMVTTFHFRGTLDIQLASKDDAKQAKPIVGQDISAADKKSSGYIDTEETLMKFGNFPEIGCNVVEIPFNNRLISLVIVVPVHTNSTDLLLTKLSAQILNDMVNSLTVKKMSIEIPVIKFNRGPINVEGLLKELNLSEFFFGNRTFSSETGLNRWLRPNDIVHETSIDIGTINPKWVQTEDRLKVGAHEKRSNREQYNQRSKVSRATNFKLEKPFFYFVIDSINSLVLTMGRIRQ